MPKRRLAALISCGTSLVSLLLLTSARLLAQEVEGRPWRFAAATPFSVEMFGRVGSVDYNITKVTVSSPADPRAYVMVPDYTGWFDSGTLVLADLTGPSDPLQLAFGPGTPELASGIYSFPMPGLTGITVPFVMLGDGVVTGSMYLDGSLVGSVTASVDRLPGRAYSIGSISAGWGPAPLLFDRLVLTSTAPQFGITGTPTVRVSALPEPGTVTLVATGTLALAGAAVGQRRRRG